ncbi:PREDICTED: beta-glucosidase 18-like isoform X2 [Prunus mume]|uniref:Beta-glucosidase 18-like isoform X2 n=1 Tax=Prunus mume TaxID=102107 RepID=A0ABM0NLR7_PRUMU|nr:PREDICTED: beta-glucosidase 18-like isoform X2 [Prunus mume]
MKFTGRGMLCFFWYSFVLVSSTFSAQSFKENEEIRRSQFPDGFLFGAGTSSYQVEGAYLEDGKSLSNWDVFCHTPGTIESNENGDVADDHYHRYLEDIELMHSLGMNSYRFSISWARILPDGMLGKTNPSGITFYNKLIDHLLLKGIEPFVTVHHNDMPQVLEQRDGGWLSPLLREEFAHFASICFKSFGDRVKYWITFNEPNLMIEFAYIRGWYPPARCSTPFGNCSSGNSDTEPLIAMHNILIAHATAVDTYRRVFWPKQHGFIGIVANAHMYEPLRDDERDRHAVDRALAFNVAWMFDPLVHGDYPSEMRECPGLELPRFSHNEKQLLRGSIDFIGFNHYSTLYVKDCIHSACPLGGDHAIRGFLNTTGYRDGVPIGEPTGMPRFFVVPRGMEKMLDYLKQRYNNKPMFITENGYSLPTPQTELQDWNRIKFHKAYMASVARAIRNGADVRGYFIWSLMDNFEWLSGYTTRFGLYYVDRKTLHRTPKLSAGWFASFLRNSSHNDREEIRAASGHNNNIIFSQLEAKVAEM